MKKIMAILICIALFLCNLSTYSLAASSKPTLSKKSILLKAGEKKTLSIKGNLIKKSVFLSCNRGVATISTKGVLKGIKKGTAKIQVIVIYKKTKHSKKYSIKILTCSVTITKKGVTTTNNPQTVKTTPAPIATPKVSQTVTPTPTPSSSPDAKVLFVGNSFTYVNDLPRMFQNLAKSGGIDVLVDSSAPGGYTLAQHVDPNDSNGKVTLEKIKSTKWHYVVLQEQSQCPAYDDWRGSFYSASRTLHDLIRENGSTPVFYMTWGYKNGDLSNDVPATQTFKGMQEQLQIGYETIARELSDPISPVGIAWLNANETYPSINLWGSDDKHPSVEGTYLTACVMYETLLKKSPVGIPYYDSLTSQTAICLQEIAHQTCSTYSY